MLPAAPSISSAPWLPPCDPSGLVVCCKRTGVCGAIIRLDLVADTALVQRLCFSPEDQTLEEKDTPAESLTMLSASDLRLCPVRVKSRVRFLGVQQDRC